MQTIASNALRDRASGARRRPGHRRGAGARRQGAEAGQQRAGLADEAGLGARRHRHRPGRLLRGLAPDHARRPDLQGAQLGVLLRGEHARRGAEHLDLRADQRDAALRRRAGQQGLAARRCADDHALRPGPQHPRGPAHLRRRRRGVRPGARSSLDVRLLGPDDGAPAAPVGARLVAGARAVAAPTSTTSRSSAAWRANTLVGLPPRPAPLRGASAPHRGIGRARAGRREADVGDVPGVGCAQGATSIPPLAAAVARRARSSRCAGFHRFARARGARGS